MGIRPRMYSVMGIADLKKDSKGTIIDPRMVDLDKFNNMNEDRFEVPKIEGEADYSNKEHLRIAGLRGMFTDKSGTPLTKDEKIYYDWEDSHSTVVGYQLDDIGGDTLYTLSATDERFTYPGHIVVPSVNPLHVTNISVLKETLDKGGFGACRQVLKLWYEDPHLSSMIKHQLKYKREGKLYRHEDFVRTKLRTQWAQYALSQIGLEVEDRHIKLILVWNWS